jgi:hypothetical protein
MSKSAPQPATRKTPRGGTVGGLVERLDGERGEDGGEAY